MDTETLSVPACTQSQPAYRYASIYRSILFWGSVHVILRVCFTAVLSKWTLDFFGKFLKKLEMDWSKWMMMKRGKVDKQEESMVASYRYLEISNSGLQMIGCNEWDDSYLKGTRASFQYIRRIPALYFSQA